MVGLVNPCALSLLALGVVMETKPRLLVKVTPAAREIYVNAPPISPDFPMKLANRTLLGKVLQSFDHAVKYWDVTNQTVSSAAPSTRFGLGKRVFDHRHWAITKC
jgi:hypothetical protein